MAATNKFLDDFGDVLGEKELSERQKALEFVPEGFRPYATKLEYRDSFHHDIHDAICKIGDDVEFRDNFTWHNIGGTGPDFEPVDDYLKYLSINGKHIELPLEERSEEIANVLIIYSKTISMLKKMPDSMVQKSKLYSLKTEIEWYLSQIKQGKIDKNTEFGFVPTYFSADKFDKIINTAKAKAYIQMFKEAGLECTMKMRLLMHTDPVKFMNNAKEMYNEMVNDKEKKQAMAKIKEEYRQRDRENKERLKQAKAERLEGLKQLKAQKQAEKEKRHTQLKGVNLEL